MPSQPFLSTLLAAIAATAEALEGTASSNAATCSTPVQGPASQDLRHAMQHAIILSIELIRQKCERIIYGQPDLWDMAQLVAVCSIIQGVRLWKKGSFTQQRQSEVRDAGPDQNKSSITGGFGLKRSSYSNAELTDPGLLKKHSTFRSYTTPIATYPSIRTFYRPHYQADKLPCEPTPLPLLVFVHGLGGSLAQFHPLLTSLVNVGPCLGVDLPGCGRSAFSPTSWNAYTPKALAGLLRVVISEHCDHDKGQGIVLIGHSAGCSFSVLVAQAPQPVEVLGLIGICPQATPPSDKQIATFEKLLLVPNPIFEVWRTWDRRGGTESASVTRFVGKDADVEVKKLQERFNVQSRTAVWRRMAWGALPRRDKKEKEPEKGLPGLDVWASLKVPLFLIGGEGDDITKTDQIVKIGRALGKVDPPASSQSTKPELDEKGNMIGNADHLALDEKRQSRASHTELTVIGDTLHPVPEAVASYSKRRRVLKTSVLPSPASHALLYDPATYRTLAGLIQDFLWEHVDTRLSLGWQLQHLSTEGKWDVKNLAKWQAVRPVSEPIAGIFRAMKTLREIDDTHSPDVFVRNWKSKIKAVIDISHESPVYNPKGLNEGGIEYNKFPTVSKIPPTAEEAKDFNKLVDRLRARPRSSRSPAGEEAQIGVHCHYGFNRTGFFICGYLIENEGYGVQQAIDEFAKARPPGIRHEHFQAALFVRYCVGLKRAPTM